MKLGSEQFQRYGRSGDRPSRVSGMGIEHKSTVPEPLATRMKWSWLFNILLIVSGAGVGRAAQPLPPNPDGTFRNAAYVFTLDTTTNLLYRKKETPEETELPRETLPAEADSESAWGPVSGGYRLCLRFEKEVFQLGEPIVASVLVRNVSDVFLWDGLGIGGNAQFFVADVSGKEVRVKVPLPPATRREMIALWRGTQYKFKVPLSDVFALDRPGVYTVSANKEVGATRVPTNVLMSGIATIRIVASKTSDDSSTHRTISTASESSQVSRIDEGATGQSAGAPAEMTRTGAIASVQPSQATSSMPTAEPQSNSSASTSESGGTHLGFASSPVRISASVFVLLVAAALVYILRRVRRSS